MIVFAILTTALGFVGGAFLFGREYGRNEGRAEYLDARIDSEALECLRSLHPGTCDLPPLDIRRTARKLRLVPYNWEEGA